MLSGSTISKTAAALSIIGVLLLALQQQAQTKTVSEALETEKGKQIEIKAKIGWARQSGQSVFFELDDGNKITASFSGTDSAQIALIKPNKLVRAKGTVSRNKGKTVFLAEEVIAVD